MGLFIVNLVLLALITTVITWIIPMKGILGQIFVLAMALIMIAWTCQFFGLDLPVKIPYLVKEFKT